MPTRPRVKEVTAIISEPPVLRLGEKGEMSANLLSSLNLFLQEIAKKVNGYLSLGGGNHAAWAGNVDAQYVELTFGSADSEMMIPHGLNRLPIGVIVVRRDRACSVYDGSDNTWGKKYLYLKCDTESAVVRLLVF
jgi:hypothetical protein